MRIRWRGLELPHKISADRETLSDVYGRFTVEPFERGFGITVGNSLRRVMLSSLSGSAVTSISMNALSLFINGRMRLMTTSFSKPATDR